MNVGAQSAEGVIVLPEYQSLSCQVQLLYSLHFFLFYVHVLSVETCVLMLLGAAVLQDALFIQPKVKCRRLRTKIHGPVKLSRFYIEQFRFRFQTKQSC